MTLKLSYLPSLDCLEFQTWFWPKERDCVFFDEILVEKIGSDNFTREHGRLLSIECTVVSHVRTWWLQNQVEGLVCVLNASELKPGLKQRLNHGDVLEFGFSRFDIAIDTSNSCATESNVDLLKEFDLTDLATGDKSLDFLLAEDRFVINQKSTQASQVDDVVNADVFGQLHAQYLRQLENPWGESSSENLWLDVQRGNQQSSFDPMLVLMTQAQGRTDLADLLGEQEQILSVMKSLGLHDGHDVLTPEKFPNVMKLFAPIGLQEEDEGINSSHQVPGLTQREHHSVSLDSVISTNLKTAQYD
jgi:hypothetical protein